MSARCKRHTVCYGLADMDVRTETSTELPTCSLRGASRANGTRNLGYQECGLHE